MKVWPKSMYPSTRGGKKTNLMRIFFISDLETNVPYLPLRGFFN